MSICHIGGPISHSALAPVQKAEAAVAKREGGKEGAEIQDTSLPGMAFMMECYEGELKRPIRNLVNGRLLRTILIQVQPLTLLREDSVWSRVSPVAGGGRWRSSSSSSSGRSFHYAPAVP